MQHFINFHETFNVEADPFLINLITKISPQPVSVFLPNNVRTFIVLARFTSQLARIPKLIT